MGESHQHHNHQHHGHQLLHSPRPPAQSRLGGMKGPGEIVEVQGGHIVRSTGRKDRHSKVFTAKGPRDRRVRLSAHTAIQFYDVQDRLGYDRPSKAVDWLIKNAKAAIDELAELPAGIPPGPRPPTRPPTELGPMEEETTDAVGESSKRPSQTSEPLGSSPFGFTSSSILPPSLDSDAIADTIKSFFPISAATGGSSSPPIGFQSYPVDFMSRTSSQGQDLRLSLHSFQEPILLHGHPPPATQHRQAGSAAEQVLFSNYDAGSGSWSEQNLRMFPWNGAPEGGIGGATGGGNNGGYIFTMPPPHATPLHPLLGQSSYFSQRGPLQSSSPSHVRAWTDTFAAAEHQSYAAAMHLPGSSAGFAAGGFSGFRVPARIQGEDEHDGIPSKPSSASRQ
ncbi:unnamed protein product [Spirodela intermedia]|uniref:TCP domain-containing protein n=1 Tax=Spirodela intermedia TaxID=51605 RepID=A0A7I8J8P1_SPIIN|nr:unnamed protein product [Spirodela intermedia]CAA6665812.1 unnamed protein product [Spirodela intermedia]